MTAGPFLGCQDKEESAPPSRGSALVSTGLLALAGERGTALVGVSCRGPQKKPENIVCKQNLGNKNFLNSSLLNMH